MKKLGAFFICLLFFAACGNPDDGLPKIQKGDFPVTAGEITLEKRPTRAVVLSASLADIIVDMELEVLLAGRADECDNPALAALPTVGSGTMPDAALLASLNADLVLTSQPPSESIRQWLTDSNIPLLVLPPAKDPLSLQALYKTLAAALMGEITGTVIAAEKSFAFTEELHTVHASGTVLLELEYGFVATGDTFLGYLLRAVGFENVAEDGRELMPPEEMAEPARILMPTPEQQKVLLSQSLRGLEVLKELLG